jgi:hypothetical protein
MGDLCVEDNAHYSAVLVEPLNYVNATSTF